MSNIYDVAAGISDVDVASPLRHCAKPCVIGVIALDPTVCRYKKKRRKKIENAETNKLEIIALGS